MMPATRARPTGTYHIMVLCGIVLSAQAALRSWLVGKLTMLGFRWRTDGRSARRRDFLPVAPPPATASVGAAGVGNYYTSVAMTYVSDANLSILRSKNPWRECCKASS